MRHGSISWYIGDQDSVFTIFLFDFTQILQQYKFAARANALIFGPIYGTLQSQTGTRAYLFCVFP